MATQADGTAQREAAMLMLHTRATPDRRRRMVGRRQRYGTRDFVDILRELRVTPHVAYPAARRDQQLGLGRNEFGFFSVYRIKSITSLSLLVSTMACGLLQRRNRRSEPAVPPPISPRQQSTKLIALGVILGVIRFATAANGGEQAQAVANSRKALNPCPEPR